MSSYNLSGLEDPHRGGFCDSVDADLDEFIDIVFFWGVGIWDDGSLDSPFKFQAWMDHPLRERSNTLLCKECYNRLLFLKLTRGMDI